MNRTILLVIAFLAVFAESLLAPYYPLYFERVFHIHDANTIGWYIAGCRIIFMAAYPVWAMISKRYALRDILVCTQGIAGLICIVCAYSTDYTFFLVLSLLMFFFKASYLLIYPHLIKKSSSRYKEISFLGVILNVGMVTSAFASSWWIGQFQIQSLFFIIAAFDFLQMIFSYCFLKREHLDIVSEKQKHPSLTIDTALLMRIGSLTLFLYLLSTTLRPFYTEFILSQKIYTHSILQAGCLFILPSFSVIIFYFIFRKGNDSISNATLMFVTVLFIATIYVQQYEMPFILNCLIRISYGFFLFYLCVYLDMTFFSSVENIHASVWYGLIHTIQNVAYLAAPLYAGYQIEIYGLGAQFDIAFIFSLIFLSIVIVTSISFKSKQHKYESFR
jgi:DHA1 family multidrug resistance protein-like MFS transporter